MKGSHKSLVYTTTLIIKDDEALPRSLGQSAHMKLYLPHLNEQCCTQAQDPGCALKLFALYVRATRGFFRCQDL